MTESQIIEVTEKAATQILEFRAQEPGDDEYALLIEVTGTRGNQFAYDLSFIPVVDKEETDVLERHGELPLIIPERDVENIRGASLDMSKDLLNPGLVMNNPNTPSPVIAPEVGELEGSVAERVGQVLNLHINPAIAAHGGAAELVGVEGETAYLRLMGGCQGCGLAAVTLRQGIETAILQAVPEITAVADVTDHAAGENPYFEPAAK
ncbi:MAG: NifU family protein [Acidimicrobiia bacterium]